VYLADAAPEATENCFGFRHRRVNLPCVSDVEAESRLWESAKQFRQLACTPADRLSFVHVFQAQAFAQLSPEGIVCNDIRMNNHRPASTGNFAKQVDDFTFG
jgi:hypothetical protein